MKQPTKDELMLDMHLDIEAHLSAIEMTLARYGLVTVTKLTMIARDPKNDNLIVVLTTEDLPGLEEACKLAIKQQVVNHRA